MLIARELRIYITLALQEDMSDEEDAAADDYTSDMSFESENLHYNFKNQLEMLGDVVKLPGFKLLVEVEGPEYLGFATTDVQDSSMLNLNMG